jgi:hypothetical protein
MSSELDRFRDALNERIDGGGCAEAWAATRAHRTDREDTDGGGTRTRDEDAPATVPDGDRRNLLRSTGLVTAGLAASGLGIGEAAAAEPPAESDVTLTPAAAERVVATEAAELLEALAARGYIADARPAALGFDDVRVGRGHSRSTLRVSRGTHPERGEYVRLSTPLPAGEFDRDIVVSVAPALDTAAATAVRDGEPHILRADTDGFVPLSSTSTVDCWCEYSPDCECNCAYGYNYGRYVCDGTKVYHCWEEFDECQLDCSCGGW